MGWLKERKRKQLIGVIQDAKADFEDAVQKTIQMTGGLDARQQDLVEDLLGKPVRQGEAPAKGKFDLLLEEAQEAKFRYFWFFDPEYDNIETRASNLERLSLYILPLKELPMLASSALAELQEWKVPDGVIKGIKDDVKNDLWGAGPLDRDRVITDVI